MVVLVCPQACEVGVDITINRKVAAGLEDKAIGGGAEQVSPDGFDGESMGLFGSVRESSALVDGESDVGTGVVAEVEEHADDRSVVPLSRVKRGSIGIRPESCLGCGSPFGVAVDKAEGDNDTVCEARLSECEGRGCTDCVARDLDAEERCKLSFVGEFAIFFEVGDEEVECRVALARKDDVVDVDDQDELVRVEEAGVEPTLGEPTFEEFGFEMFKPQLGCLGDPIEALLKFEADIVVCVTVKAAGKMDEDVVMKIRLDKRVAEIDASCFEVEEKSKVEYKANGGPKDDGGEGIGDGLLKVTSNAPSCFEALNGAVGVSFAAKSPGAGENFVGGGGLRNDGPGFVGDEGSDFLEHGRLPFGSVVGVDGLIVGEGIRITGGGDISGKVGKIDGCRGRLVIVKKAGEQMEFLVIWNGSGSNVGASGSARRRRCRCFLSQRLWGSLGARQSREFSDCGTVRGALWLPQWRGQYWRETWRRLCW